MDNNNHNNHNHCTVLITDTHFGTHGNSLSWLKSQKEFFTEQFIPYLITKKSEGYKIRIVHCGDVFDSRSTINTYIATEVVGLFSRICEIVDKFIIVGGNHDYYSPENDEVDTIGLVFNQLCLKYPHFIYITKTKVFDEEWESLYIPWYEWNKQDELKVFLKNNLGIKYIYTHADLVHENITIECPNIISGHIHTPYFKGNIMNLGSTFALNFSDYNSPRGFYEHINELKFIENKHSIRFWRFYDDDVLAIPEYVKKNDYIELYISKSKIIQKKYIDAYAKWTEKFKNIWRIPQFENQDIKENIKKFEGYNIEHIVESQIPTELKDKFNQIKKYIIK